MSRSQNTDLPAVIKPPDWPANDRLLWQKGTTWDTGHFLRPYAARLQPITIRNAARAYGRLLAVLRDHGSLDESATPAVRLTPEIADVFLRALLAAGNNNNTIKVRFFDLQAAMKIMYPHLDFSWLHHPEGMSLHSLLPTAPTPRRLIGADRLHQWAWSLMKASDDQPTAVKRALMLRNGLLIAILICRAPRQRSLAEMRLGQHVWVDGDDIWIKLAPDNVKNARRLEYRLPGDLVPWAKRYIGEARPILLGDACHDAFWVGQGGVEMKPAALAGALRRASERAHGRDLGTHHFRHELASALADQDPDNPGVAAAILGISPAVAEASYTHARNELAAKCIADHLAAEREQTRLLAERLYGVRADAG